ERGNANPTASDTAAIVFAVNSPPHDPAEGQATHSSSCSSSSVSLPTLCAPTPSNTSPIVTSLPLKRPGRIEPPYIKTEGTLSRTIAIISPGSDLSQPASPTSAS